MNSKQSRFWGSFHAALAIIMGAFAAHALKNRLDQSMIEIVKTGAHYELIHGVVIWFIGNSDEKKLYSKASLMFCVGASLFAWSLYLLAVTSEKSLGMITPLGGVSMIAGWATLGFESYRNKLSNK